MRILAATLLAASCLATVAAAGCAAGTIDPVTTSAVGDGCGLMCPPPPASSVVRIDLSGGGHGSGVYIGNGVILTAAHVAKGEKMVMVKMDNGTVQSADVLWVNEAYDVAALAPVHPNQMSPSPLSCRTPTVGDAIVAAGSPGDNDNLYIPGKIAGNERSNAVWKSVVVGNVTAGHGISGGGVFNDAGEVVGILVGGALDYTPDPVDGKFDLTSMGLAFIVPGSAVCGLLGRV
ncbi:serine protease [Mesorhizobium sp. BR1-1-3]|uniref:S1 family peptidase n=1 Tax=Mesorhizobium sp. BR1-1-3 TaxID=2876651 RepID=UPI001CD139C7|nr:serine protease [Mesorhizobium sp. BR1-1-3]MBZ9888140.1 serine protease [Mesorhizobium sp. BR1-1-3]